MDLFFYKWDIRCDFCYKAARNFWQFKQQPSEKYCVREVLNLIVLWRLKSLLEENWLKNKSFESVVTFVGHEKLAVFFVNASYGMQNFTVSLSYFLPLIYFYYWKRKELFLHCLYPYYFSFLPYILSRFIFVSFFKLYGHFGKVSLEIYSHLHSTRWRIPFL